MTRWFYPRVDRHPTYTKVLPFAVPRASQTHVTISAAWAGVAVGVDVSAFSKPSCFDFLHGDRTELLEATNEQERHGDCCYTSLVPYADEALRHPRRQPCWFPAVATRVSSRRGNRTCSGRSPMLHFQHRRQRCHKRQQWKARRRLVLLKFFTFLDYSGCMATAAVDYASHDKRPGSSSTNTVGHGGFRGWKGRSEGTLQAESMHN